MNAVELRIRGKLHRYTGPSCWSELTARQAVAVMRLRTQPAPKTEQAFPLLSLLYGMNRRQMRWLFDDNLLRRAGIPPDDRLLILSQGQALLDSLAFINRHDDRASFCVPRFRRYDFWFGSPLMALQQAVPRTWYIGPTAGMGNCTFGEFMAADMAYRGRQWTMLAAILYRPAVAQKHPNWNDQRAGFDHAEAVHRAERFGVLHPALLATIQHGYESTLLDLQRRFPLVFPPVAPDRAKTPPTGNWLDVALGLAGLDVTKVYDIERVNLYLALKTLNTKIKQADEMEAQLEAARRA